MFSSSRFSAFHSNHQSATLNPDVLNSMVQTELKAQRVAGPFDVPPFPNFVVSPLGLVPKKETGKFHLIHNLSFPKRGFIPSVNDGILQAEAAVSAWFLTNKVLCNYSQL